MEATNQNFAPVLVLLSLVVAFLYLHFTGGSGLNRLYVAAVLTIVAVVLLLPTLNLQLPDQIKGWMPGSKIQLGLDLQGGTHLLMAVKLDEAVKSQLKRRGDDLKKELKENKLDIDITQDPNTGTLVATLKGNTDAGALNDVVTKSFPDLKMSTGNSEGGNSAYNLEFKPMFAQQVRSGAMDQALETIRNRIDQLGVRETTVVKEGDNEILVQLPGIQDPQEAKNLIGKTAVLEFKMEDDQHSIADALKDGPPPGDEILYGVPQAGGRQPYLVEKAVLMQGDVVTDARVRPGGRFEGNYVGVELDARGAQIFDTLTADNVGRKLVISLDNTVYSDPVIKERIPGGHVQITGRFSLQEAHNLVIVLKSGALPAPIEFEEERTVGPSLGRDSIRAGAISFIVGAAFVLIFMPVYYDRAGILADFGLTLNILLLLCMMAALGATLTLPGIAGIVLTLGMSVDANVLVNERMREELRNGKTPREAVKLGYQRAWDAIRDSNISTFVAGVILFLYGGTGPVKGFAVTLCVGVLTGLFSCIVVTRAWYDYQISMRRLNTISV